MTREELEEGRALLTEFRTYEAQAIANGHSPEMLGAEIEGWLLDHAAELLFLAEEARWRSVAEEPPQTNTWVCAVNDTVVVSGFVCCTGPGTWISYHGGHSIPTPTHWRPLAKRPGER